jgi:hypothetical protein
MCTSTKRTRATPRPTPHSSLGRKEALWEEREGVLGDCFGGKSLNGKGDGSVRQFVNALLLLGRRIEWMGCVLKPELTH